MNEVSSPFTTCTTFGAVNGGGEIPITVDEGPVFAGFCSCSAKGGLKAPTFDVGTSFICPTSAMSLEVVFGGKAAPGKTKKGHGTRDTGFSSIFGCVRRETPCP